MDGRIFSKLLKQLINFFWKLACIEFCEDDSPLHLNPLSGRRHIVDQHGSKDWRKLCKAAANELDPSKLMELVSEIIAALDEHDAKPGIACTAAERAIDIGTDPHKAEIARAMPAATAIT
jgi:hypothetical protein